MNVGDLVMIKFYPRYEDEPIVGLVLGIMPDAKYTRHVKLLTGGFTKVFCLYKEEGRYLDKVEVLVARG